MSGSTQLDPAHIGTARTVERAPQSRLFGRIAVAVLVVFAVLTAIPLFGPELDLQLAVATLAIVGVAALGIWLVIALPGTFGLARVTMGGAFVASMNVLILMGLPAAYDSARQHSAADAQVFLAAVLLSYLIVVLVLAGLDHRPIPVWWTGVRTRSSYVWPFVLLGVAVLAAYTVIAWPLPIFQAILGARQSELADLRARSLALLEPAILRYLFGFVRVILLPFAAGLLTVRAMTRGGIRRWLVAMAVVGLAVFAAVANVEKSVVPRTLLIVLLAGALGNQGRRRRSLTAVGAVVAAGIPILIARQANSVTTSTWDNVQALFRRATVLPSEVVLQYFVWTTEHGHLWGATLPYVSYFVPGGPVPLPTVIYDSAFASVPGQVGSANGAYVGFLWADFGWYGIVLGSVFVAVVLFVLESCCRFVGSGAPGAALRAVAFVQVAQLPSTSIFGAVLLAPFGLVDLVVVLVAWTLLAREVLPCADPRRRAGRDVSEPHDPVRRGALNG